ncbi:hypothetical protein BSK55_25205 [Paenibacillus odorifer]|nr:hypothetical protein BSK55_25205 [Paenibacillus odorifer]
MDAVCLLQLIIHVRWYTLILTDPNDAIRVFLAIRAQFRTPVQLFITKRHIYGAFCADSDDGVL